MKSKIDTKKRKKIVKMIIIGAIFLAFILILVCAVLTIITNNFKFSFKVFFSYLFDIKVLIVIIALIVGVVGYLSIDKLLKGNFKKKVLRDNIDLEQSHFQSEDEILNNPNIKEVLWSKLSQEEDGMPIAAEVVKKDIRIKLLKKDHSLVIGATGTGKTSSFVFPIINILSKTKTKPILIITDPKGELYRDTYENLKNEGYKTLFFDLSNPFGSLRYNPMSYTITKIKEFIKLQAEPIENIENKYFYNSLEFMTLQLASNYKKNILLSLESVITRNVEDVFLTLFASTDKNAPTWQGGARDFLYGVMLQLIELSKVGVIDISKVTLYNLSEIVSLYANPSLEDPNNPIREFFKSIEGFRKGAEKAGTVLVSQSNTLTSYLGHVKDFVNFINDAGVQSITSDDQLDAFNLDEQPTAVFIKMNIVEDTKINSLASIMIGQMYKIFNEKAAYNFKMGKTTDTKLLRNAYFLLDEFGNIPAITIMEKMATYGRSIGICLVPIIQDYSQLELVYEKKGQVIKNNCNCTIYIGSPDIKTQEEISKRCGEYAIASKSYSNSKDISETYSATKRPLIFPSELNSLNNPPTDMGHVIVLLGSGYPIKARFTPYFYDNAIKLYGHPKAYYPEALIQDWDSKEASLDIRNINYFNISLKELEKEPEDIKDSEYNRGRKNAPSDIIKEISAKDNKLIYYTNLIQEFIKRNLIYIPSRIQYKFLHCEIDDKFVILNQLIQIALEKADDLVVSELVSIRERLAGIKWELDTLTNNLEYSKAEYFEKVRTML
ncbi:MAG: type IV secretory system conjugative DNA transfer family protein [Acholeplasmatales bacterium]|jgi:type IV secretion system protein VirD4|nr:type IV secretory system conjugative DNA transfer family protein [Acholeplasmatales bacterium]